MGEFAETARDYVRAALTERLPRFAWRTEHRIRRTPVDVVGDTAKHFVTVELEWRRVDPVNNTAKLFYYVDQGELAAFERITVFQVFMGYYDLDSGGVSSKREVAEFVGDVAADSFAHVSFHPVTFGLTPPKRGSEWPEEWVSVAEETVDDIVRKL
ncbi:hypothetical protein [Haladaptatus sp. NG-WS-4]